jgi:hypothetical protein
MIVICFFPALWFYTGALLKEGICIFVMGAVALGWSQYRRQSKLFWLFLPAIFISFFLKPYLLLCFLTFCSIYFLIWKRERLIFQITALAGILINGFVLLNLISIQFKNRSLTEAAIEHQRRFEAVSHGGIFLTDSVLYMQLPADTNLIKYKTGDRKKVQMRGGFSYMYWHPNRSEDTLYAESEADTTRYYEVLSIIPICISTNRVLESCAQMPSTIVCFFHSLVA